MPEERDTLLHSIAKAETRLQEIDTERESRIKQPFREGDHGMADSWGSVGDWHCVGTDLATTVPMGHDTTCTATIFSINILTGDPIRTANDPHTFTTIQSAYNDPTTCGTSSCTRVSNPVRDRLKLMGTNFPEMGTSSALIFDYGKNITLQGGWDCDFYRRPGHSVVHAKITIIDGSVEFDGIVLW
jgi:hypothetical protein